MDRATMQTVFETVDRHIKDSSKLSESWLALVHLKKELEELEKESLAKMTKDYQDEEVLEDSVSEK